MFARWARIKIFYRRNFISLASTGNARFQQSIESQCWGVEENMKLEMIFAAKPIIIEKAAKEFLKWASLLFILTTFNAVHCLLTKVSFGKWVHDVIETTCARDLSFFIFSVGKHWRLVSMFPLYFIFDKLESFYVHVCNK